MGIGNLEDGKSGWEAEGGKQIAGNTQPQHDIDTHNICTEVKGELGLSGKEPKLS